MTTTTSSATETARRSVGDLVAEIAGNFDERAMLHTVDEMIAP